MDKTRIVLVNIFLSSIVIFLFLFVLNLEVDRLSPLPGRFEMLFWPLLFLGSSLIIWATVTLYKHGGATGAPADPTRHLVSKGPYRWLRNPIYLGDILLLFGLAFFTRSRAIFIMAASSVLLADLFVRFYEEPRTARRFGEEYIQYCQNVPRWIPRFLKKRRS
jgi:protein-S-isoprenylcysteine O-methyltransferase Ste14